MNDSNEGNQSLLVFGGAALAIICILIALIVS
jgi:hypothetical protein